MCAIKVLIVDDSPTFARAAEQFLRGIPNVEILGHAHSGAEALAMAAQLSPTLVLMDLVMPGMDGLEATRRLKSQPNAPKIVILSVVDPEEYAALAHGAGADAFVPKGELANQLPSFIESMA